MQVAILASAKSLRACSIVAGGRCRRIARARLFRAMTGVGMPVSEGSVMPRGSARPGQEVKDLITVSFGLPVLTCHPCAGLGRPSRAGKGLVTMLQSMRRLLGRRSVAARAREQHPLLS